MEKLSPYQKLLRVLGLDKAYKAAKSAEKAAKLAAEQEAIAKAKEAAEAEEKATQKKISDKVDKLAEDLRQQGFKFGVATNWQPSRRECSGYFYSADGHACYKLTVNEYLGHNIKRVDRN